MRRAPKLSGLCWSVVRLLCIFPTTFPKVFPVVADSACKLLSANPALLAHRINSRSTITDSRDS